MLKVLNPVNLIASLKRVLGGNSVTTDRINESVETVEKVEQKTSMDASTEKQQVVEKTKESTMTTEVVDATQNNRVGPVMRAGDVAQAVVEAAEIDNPGKEIEVEDKLAYLRISTDDEMIITKETMEECLGRSFEMRDLEINLSSFAGLIDADSDRFRFYFNKKV